MISSKVPAEFRFMQRVIRVEVLIERDRLLHVGALVVVCDCRPHRPKEGKVGDVFT